MSNRINEVIKLGKAEVSLLMTRYNPTLTVSDFSLMTESLSNTGYKVITNVGTYLLKLYSSPRHAIECSMYRYLQGRVNVPTLHFYDDSLKIVSYPYAIFAFIKGVTLAEYVRNNRQFPSGLAAQIGCLCATIHENTYPCNAQLDAHLQMFRSFSGYRGKLKYILRSKPAAYLRPETTKALTRFVKSNTALCKAIERDSVLSHGDFNFWNIMVVDETPYCIDFEFTCADSRYRDIGHFFRRKDASIDAFIDDAVYRAFEEGYSSVSAAGLPPEWRKLACMCDIVTELDLLFNDHFPEKWVADIEADIQSTIANS